MPYTVREQVRAEACCEIFLPTLYNFRMWSIRMRASQAPGGRKRKAVGIHISGAEGIYGESEIPEIVREYTERALHHSKGIPDEIVLTVEAIRGKARQAPLLPITTLDCAAPGEAREILSRRLSDLGISRRAVIRALKILTSPRTLRGASLLAALSGARVEPDKVRGVRVSRLGLDSSAAVKLEQRLSKMKVHTATVREALTLASKVASCPDILAEVCISDDPGYTTGYIASRESGYMRIPNIKGTGETHGGRVFFVREGADIRGLINYLEKTPVMVYEASTK